MLKKIKKVLFFFDDDTMYYAASLSFFTIFALLPILALILAFMSVTPYFVHLKEILLLYTLDFVNPIHSEEISNMIKIFLANIQDLSYIGFAYLLFIFTMFFNDYEYIINKIHHTKRRVFYKTAPLYISFIIIIPFFLGLLTYTATIFKGENLGYILNFLFGVSFITLINILSVNKRISIKSAFLSSVIILVILKLTQIIFIYYITYNDTLGTIYGAFSVLFFMFLWVYISWIIYLYGIKICYILNEKDKQLENS